MREISTNRKYSPSAESMLAQCRRRWTSNEPTFGQCLVVAYLSKHETFTPTLNRLALDGRGSRFQSAPAQGTKDQFWFKVVPASQMMFQHQYNTGPKSSVDP